MASATGSSLKGVIFLILTQVISRASTFILNQALLRYISPELFGISLQLELYSTSVLYFARESLRVALQRQTSNVQALVNTGFIAVALGVPLTLVLGWRYALSDLPKVLYMREAIASTGVAILLELLSEPCFAVAQQRLDYGIRARAETGATITRSIVTFSTVLWYNKQGQQFGALPFGYGQLAYGATLLMVYLLRTVSVAQTEKFSVHLKTIQSSDQSDYIFSLFSRPICVLGANLYLQFAIKYMLTQGDSIMIAAFASLQDQGAYGLASNYGGLIARIIFQPIEETSRNLFAKLCAPTTLASAPDVSGSKARSTNIKQSNNLTRAHQTLHTLLRAYLLLTLLILSLAPPIAPTLLHLIAGRAWSSTTAGSTFAAYCYYIPLLALNGVSEAFVAAVADATELRGQSVAMAGFFVFYAGSVWIFLGRWGWGSEGLVWSNCLNMWLRIFWNSWFIRRYFGRRGMEFDFVGVLPSGVSVGAAVAAATLVRRDNLIGALTGNEVLDAILWTGIVGVGLVAVVGFAERGFLRETWNFSMGERRAKMS